MNVISFWLGIIFLLEIRSLVNQVRLMKKSKELGIPLRDLYKVSSKINTRKYALISMAFGVYSSKLNQTLLIILKLIFIIACLCFFILFQVFLRTDYAEILNW